MQNKTHNNNTQKYYSTPKNTLLTDNILINSRKSQINLTNTVILLVKILVHSDMLCLHYNEFHVVLIIKFRLSVLLSMIKK